MSEAQRPAPPAPPPATEVKFTEDIHEAVNGAYAAGAPALVAYVDSDGQPSLSIRGSTRTYSDDQLAVWVRNREGGLPTALKANNRVSIMIRIPETRTTLNFRGRATLTDDPAVLDKVYSAIPENEQKADPERKGFALILDVDRLDGRTPAGAHRMQRGT